MLEKFPTSTSVIRFQDCDPMNHLNNSKYIDYMINAREDHLEEFYNLPIYSYAMTEKKGWVVGKNEIIYKRPALLMEKVLFRSRVIYYGPKRIHVEISMHDEKNTHLKAILWSTFVHIDMKTGKAIEHDSKITELLESVCAPIDQRTIEDRIAFLSN